MQQDRLESLLELKFSLSSHRDRGSALTVHTWHTFHSTGTGNPTYQVCFALLCCATFLWSQVPETYSPKEAMKTISLSRKDFHTNAAFYPLMEKQKSSEGLSGLLHLVLAKVKFSTALIHQFNTFAIKSAMLVNHYLQVRNFRDSPLKHFFVFY